MSELELDVLGGQSLVKVSNDIDFILKELFGVLVQEDFHDAGSISSVSDSSADDTSGENQIIKDSIVDGSQGSASGSDLGFMGLEPFRLDSSLGDEDDRRFNFLFKLRDESFVSSSEDRKAGVGNGDQEGVLSLLSLGGGLDFLNVGDQNVFKVVLQFSGAVLEFVKSLGNGFFMRVGLFGAGLVELGLVIGHSFSLYEN